MRRTPEDFVSMRVKGNKAAVLFTFLYLDCGAIKGRNLEVFRRLAIPVALVGKPVVVFAVWNRTPQELSDSRWLSACELEIVTPDNVEYTCTQGQQTMLDFEAISGGARPMLSSLVAFAGPWKPHFGLRAVFDMEVDKVLTKSMGVPPPFSELKVAWADRPQVNAPLGTETQGKKQVTIQSD
jgi:hypothetical protein